MFILLEIREGVESGMELKTVGRSGAELEQLNDLSKIGAPFQFIVLGTAKAMVVVERESKARPQVEWGGGVGLLSVQRSSPSIVTLVYLL